MEVEEMQSTPGCNKFPRIRNRNGRTDESSKIMSQQGEKQQRLDEEEADREIRRANGGGAGGGGGVVVGGLDISAPGGLGRLCGWPSSRIVRVSRASGGKDRHSKVLTSKGLRDRRVRLSVNTAIQFYDLQDRLGYDQPSKAVEWLLRAAASSIAELPSINASFPDTPQQMSDEKRSSGGTEHGVDSAEVEIGEEEPNYQQQEQPHQHHFGTFSKSACSSTSETSKGSGLSLSRSESRIKARERARERAAEKEKEKEKDESSLVAHQPHQNVNPIQQNASFTELLTGGMNNSANNVSNTSNNNNTTSPNGSSIHQNPGGGRGGRGNSSNGNENEANFFHKSPRQWASSTPMDYFATGLLGLSSTRAANQSSSSFLGQIQLGNHLHQSLSSVSSPLFTVTGDHHHPDLQHFSFVPDHLVPVVTAAGAGGNNQSSHSTGNGSNGGDYNLNFTISSSSSSGLAGLYRGTLQSNSSSSPSLLPPPHVQRFSPIDGPSSGFFTTTAAPPNAAVAPVENHHHHFLPGLQLCYGDGGSQHSDQKPKGKN